MSTIKRGMPAIHPGEFLKAELIEANGLTVSKIAGMLGVALQFW